MSLDDKTPACFLHRISKVPPEVAHRTPSLLQHTTTPKKSDAVDHHTSPYSSPHMVVLSSISSFSRHDRLIHRSFSLRYNNNVDISAAGYYYLGLADPCRGGFWLFVQTRSLPTRSFPWYGKSFLL